MGNLQDEQPWDALIKMANQIACNIAPGKNQEQAARAMADHLVRFWARSMKVQIIDCLEMKNNRLDPIAVDAIKLLKEMHKQSENH